MFRCSIHPRFSDTDALGHINNTVIPVWFLEAREPVLRLFSPSLDIAKAALAVVRIEVDYVAETRFGSDVEVITRVAKLGNSSLQLAQELWQEGTVRAVGLATLVNFDPRERRATPIPDHIRAALAEHLSASSEE
ncbi:MAG: thioesterase family protein [Alcanivoracaceae bacterium]|nr:thioesterase family protein [Alcanivoracaceae bacterium]